MHFIVLLWGFTSILGKLISLSSVEVVVWRTGLAVAAMWLLFGSRVRKATLPPGLAGKCILMGSLITMHWFTFFLAARVGNVSSCLAGIATGSVWTALLEPAFERRRVNRADLLTAVVVLLGLLVIFYEQADAAVGVGIGIFSASFASVFSILNRHFVRQSDTYSVSVFGLTGAFLFSLLLLPAGLLLGITPTLLPALPVGYDWLWLFLLSGVCTVFAYTVSIELLKRFSAFAATLAVNMEPVYGIILAWLIFKQAEAMSTGFYVGTALILLAVVGHSILSGRIAPGKQLAESSS